MTTPRSSAAVRNLILDTASRLFVSQGFQATGINQIINESAIAKASFYHHFPSKQALGLAFIERRHQRWFDVIEQRLAVEKTPGSKVLSLFSVWNEQIAAEGFRGCLFVNIAADFPDPSSSVRQSVKTHKEAVRTLIKQLVAEHTVVHDISCDADTIYLLYDGALIETAHFQSTWPIESARRAVARLLGVTEMN